uniref:Uncharacterized protein n=1 Tax=uncultured Desulfobacterium sp. TaxID=201089 RepID=E1YK07_9BACT|nr:unknown protein [uncultured Desulfobacterium sp.]
MKRKAWYRITRLFYFILHDYGGAGYLRNLILGCFLVGLDGIC